jgi:hypothetical protein
MVNPNISEILDAAQKLSDAERQELRRLLDRLPPGQPEQTEEDRIDQLLRSRGVIRTVPPKRTPETIAQIRAWKPIKMPGGPLSEELIRDRR